MRRSIGPRVFNRVTRPARICPDGAGYRAWVDDLGELQIFTQFKDSPSLRCYVLENLKTGEEIASTMTLTELAREIPPHLKGSLTSLSFPMPRQQVTGLFASLHENSPLI